MIKLRCSFRVNNLDKCTNALGKGTMEWLEDSATLLERTIKAETPKLTGKTAASWQHEVIRESRVKAVARIFSEHPNAAFNEFGTGEHSQKGHYPDWKGKMPWVYQDEEGNWHRTSGKVPKETARNAWKTVLPTILSWAKGILRG